MNLSYLGRFDSISENIISVVCHFGNDPAPSLPHRMPLASTAELAAFTKLPLGPTTYVTQTPKPESRSNPCCRSAACQPEELKVVTIVAFSISFLISFIIPFFFPFQHRKDLTCAWTFQNERALAVV